MNNTQIVVAESIAKGIYTEEQANAYLEKGDLPIHTYKAWRKAGFAVCKGQKARLVTKLWKQTKVKNKESGELEERYVKVKSFLFTEDQVAPVTE